MNTISNGTPQPATGPVPRFDDLVDSRLAAMSPAAQRVARFFQLNREAVLIEPAISLAAMAGTSDATIVRTARALGFAGLDALRRMLAAELRAPDTPAGRLARTLGEVGDTPASALAATLTMHVQTLEGLARAIQPELFVAATARIAGARRIACFGLGPSGAIAGYLGIQLARFGVEVVTLSQTGLLFADELRKLRPGDVVVMLAYGRVYAELAVLLDEIHRLGLGSILLTDTLASRLGDRVDVILPVPRGRAEAFSMHTGTIGLIDALLVGVASLRPAETLASLEELNNLRRRLAGKVAGLIRIN